MTNRTLRDRLAAPAWLLGLAAVALATPALAASETTSERLLNADAEPQNCGRFEIR